LVRLLCVSAVALSRQALAFIRDIVLTTAMMLALTCGFAHAASTNDGMFESAALRELHKLVIASAQSERAAKDSDRIGCRDAYDSLQKAAHEALTNMHQIRSYRLTRLTTCHLCCGSAI
jgi:hypothetical protein